MFSKKINKKQKKSIIKRIVIYENKSISLFKYSL